MGCCCAKANELVDKKFNSNEIILKDGMANNGGISSGGQCQCKGNGILLLTENVLFFIQYCCGANEEGLEISLENVINIKTAKSWMGKRNMMDFLVIEYSDNHGNNDSIGIQVRDINSWINKLKEKTSKTI